MKKLESLKSLTIFFWVIFPTCVAHAETQLELGHRALSSLTGCYLVDYSFTETESLKPGYTRDPRVYDVNKDKSVKEWIYKENISEKKIRLQHILFATDLTGKIMDGSLLKHQAEDWEFDSPFLYDFSAPLTWLVKDLTSTPGLWTRRITNLDDGLRYQCSASWNPGTAYPEWSCGNYAPIPGRETRDMGRKDYNTLARSTRLIGYGSNWLERQDNVKTIDQSGTRIPLARELGKTWYVRIPDSECSEAQAFAQMRQSSRSLLRETWDQVLVGDRPFIEKTIPGQSPRFAQISTLIEKISNQDLSNPKIRDAARSAILKLISDYRVN